MVILIIKCPSILFRDERQANDERHDSAAPAGAPSVTDEVQKVIALVVNNLKEATNNTPLSEIAHKSGVPELKLRSILDGSAQPSFAEIALFEHALDVDLWPGRTL
jgi:DNA-binding phage protein